ncbi:MAG: DUF697 domain-containing protein [Desulfobacterales bacterium]|nr:DUF697 domain-containing protein [Desulfobacterales bacterium]
MENNIKVIPKHCKSSPELESIIRNHTHLAVGIGLVPLPVFDIVGVTAVQLNMLRKIANLYDVPFSKDKGKHVIASLLGGSLSVAFSRFFSSMIKTIPIIGQTTGLVTMSIIAGATTYAIGKVFEQHFESGGTFLDFDPIKVKDYYAQMFKEGQALSKNIEKGKDSNHHESVRQQTENLDKIAVIDSPVIKEPSEIKDHEKGQEVTVLTNESSEEIDTIPCIENSEKVNDAEPTTTAKENQWISPDV